MSRRLSSTLIFLILAVFTSCNGGNGPVIPDSFPFARFLHSALNGYIVGESIVFDASASTGGFSEIVSYEWDWGDGSDSESYNNPTAAHIFGTTGPYEVSLTIYTQIGESDTVAQQINILLKGNFPTARLTYDDSEGWNPGSVFHFDASTSSDPDDDIVSYTWDWGNGESSGPLSDPGVIYSYDSAGEYSVKLTVEDSTGRTDESEMLELSIGVPDNPVVVGEYELDWEYSAASNDTHIAIDGDYLFVIGRFEGLQIFDLSVPSQPVLISQLFFGVSGPRGFTYSEGYIYIPDSDNGLLIYDVTDPATPYMASNVQIPTGGGAIHGNIVYQSGSTGPESRQLSVIDVSNKRDPEVIQVLEHTDYISSMVVSDEFLVCTSKTYSEGDYYYWTLIYRRSESGELGSLSRFSNEREKTNVVMSNGRIVLSGGYQLHHYLIEDTGDSVNINLVDTIEQVDGDNMVFHRDFLYVEDGGINVDDLRVLEISGSGEFIPYSSEVILYGATDMDIEGNRAVFLSTRLFNDGPAIITTVELW